MKWFCGKVIRDCKFMVKIYIILVIDFKSGFHFRLKYSTHSSLRTLIWMRRMGVWDDSECILGKCVFRMSSLPGSQLEYGQPAFNIGCSNANETWTKINKQLTSWPNYGFAFLYLFMLSNCLGIYRQMEIPSQTKWIYAQKSNQFFYHISSAWNDLLQMDLFGIFFDNVVSFRLVVLRLVVLVSVCVYLWFDSSLMWLRV